MRSILLLFVAPLLLLTLIGSWWFLSSDPAPSWSEVRLTRGSIAREAVAVGRIEPVFEIPVTAVNGGIVTRVFVAMGQRVEAGASLVEVRPVLTDRQRLAAKRQLTAAREAEQSAEEIQAGENLLGGILRTVQGTASMDRLRAAASRGRASAEEQVKLLLEGRVEVDGHVIDWVIRAPNTGHVLQLDAEVGMPVVPASQFGSGTELCVIGDLDRPVFRGTVEERDAGTLRKGMPARLTLGALPGVELVGSLTEISLRGQSRNNTVEFPIELSIQLPEGFPLRAGYSAVARVELERVDDALLVPERLLDFTPGSTVGQARVRVRGTDGAPAWRAVTLGLGDGLSIEVADGLSASDVLLERRDGS